MSPSARSIVGALFTAMVLTVLPASAQDARLDAAKQKAAVTANLKKAGFTRTAIVESKHFVVATTLSEEKAKSLGTAFDRVVPIARKALQFDAKEDAWKGKLAVYYLPDGSDFKSFIRSVVVSQPEGVHYALRSDEPFIVDPAEAPANSTEAEQFTSAAAIVAGAYLKAKAASGELPDWLVGGFGRVTSLRTDGLNAKRYLAYRSSARTLANRGAKPTELWSESPPANQEVLATSLAEYLAYGPGAANFAKFVVGLRPDENGNPTSIPAAFEAAGWKDLGMLESAWRKWAASPR